MVVYIHVHFCHHCGVSGHTRPNCYKWLATQQSNSVLSSGGQGQIPPSLGPLEDLLKAFMFLSNLNGLNSSPSPPEQRFNSRKGSSSKTKVGKEKGLKWFNYFLFSLSLFLFLFMFLHYLFVLLSCFWVNVVLCFVCLHVLFVCFLFCFVLFFIKIKIKKLKN